MFLFNMEKCTKWKARKKIHYSCEDEIGKSVPHTSLVMLISDPWDVFFYPTIILMTYSYNLFLTILALTSIFISDEAKHMLVILIEGVK